MLRKIKQQLLSPFRFEPDLNPAVDPDVLVAQAAAYFSLPLEGTRHVFEAYRQLHNTQRYAETLGERKTLAFEEAFLIYLSLSLLRPAQVVEIGTQYGKSTRRILDMFAHLGLESRLTCFDVACEIRHVDESEINLVLHDLTPDFKPRVLEAIAPGLIYLDAHPYHLLKNVIRGFLEWDPPHPALLAIHDCGPGLYNPHMRISKDDPSAIGSGTGHWERHVLAEVFGAQNAALDDLRTETHHLRTFGTPHGLALLASHAGLQGLTEHPAG